MFVRQALVVQLSPAGPPYGYTDAENTTFLEDMTVYELVSSRDGFLPDSGQLSSQNTEAC